MLKFTGVEEHCALKLRKASRKQCVFEFFGLLEQDAFESTKPGWAPRLDSNVAPDLLK